MALSAGRNRIVLILGIPDGGIPVRISMKMLQSIENKYFRKNILSSNQFAVF